MSRNWIRHAALYTAVSTVLTAAVAVMINVWTATWGWLAGIAAAVLVAGLAALEIRRAGRPDEAGQHRVNQRLKRMTGSRAVGFAGKADRSVTVEQAIDNIKDSTVIGIDQT